MSLKHETEQIFYGAMANVADEGIFSPDQITALQELLNAIKEALEKELEQGK